MARYKPYSYEQGQLIPVQFSRQILPDTFEHALNYIVENVMDVSTFANRLKNDLTGAPAYDPKVLLKIIFYAYSRGIISSREIERSCRDNVVFMALSANTRPHFTTIADFISSMSDGIAPLFLNVLMYCDRLGLIGKEMFAIDGCKISSNASKEWSGTRADFERKKQKYESAISYLISKHRSEDEKGEVEPEDRQKEKKAQAGLEEKVDKITKWLEKNDDKPGKQGKVKKSHMIDNESAKMMSSHGVVQGYNGIAGVDSKHQVIVDAKAFGDGSEQENLKPMVKGLQENLKSVDARDVLAEAKVLADSGYHSEDNMVFLHDEKIDAYVADNRFRKRDPRYAGAKQYKDPINEKRPSSRRYFGPESFTYDEVRDELECPAGKRLTLKTRNFYTKNGFFGKAYMAKAEDCGSCPLRAQCLRNLQTPARQAHRFAGRGENKRKPTMSQWMRERIDSVKGRLIYSQRMGIVEPVFANIRDKLKLNRFTLRGQKKVDAQWKMYAIVHNMLKAYRFGVPQRYPRQDKAGNRRKVGISKNRSEKRKVQIK